MISGFRSEVFENCTLLGYHAACCGNFYRYFETTYWSHLQKSRIQNNPFRFLTPDDENDRLYRNVGKKLPLLAN